MYSVVLLMALNACGDLPVMENASGSCGCTACGGSTVVYVPSSNCTGSCHGGWPPGLWKRFFSHEPLIGTCHGGSGCCGGGFPARGVFVAVATPVTTPPSQPLTTASAQVQTERIALPETVPSVWSVEHDHAASAVIVVRLPAAASLTVDGRPTHQTSGRRQFTSPPLQPGTDYRYTFRAQISQDGDIVSASKQVRVRAGQKIDIYLKFPELSVVKR